MPPRIFDPLIMIDADDGNFMDLPRELQVLVLSLLDLRDLLVVTRVRHLLSQAT